MPGKRAPVNFTAALPLPDPLPASVASKLPSKTDIEAAAKSSSTGPSKSAKKRQAKAAAKARAAAPSPSTGEAKADEVPDITALVITEAVTEPPVPSSAAKTPLPAAYSQVAKTSPPATSAEPTQRAKLPVHSLGVSGGKPVQPELPGALTQPAATSTGEPAIYFAGNTENSFLAPGSNMPSGFTVDKKLLGEKGYIRCESVEHALMYSFAVVQMSPKLEGAMRDGKLARRHTRLQAFLDEYGIHGEYDAHKAEQVEAIVRAAFRPHAQLQRAVQLLDTGNRRLVFVDDDSVLGSGASMLETRRVAGKCGQNLLGEALMKVRAELQKSAPNAKKDLEKSNKATENGFW